MRLVSLGYPLVKLMKTKVCPRGQLPRRRALQPQPGQPSGRRPGGHPRHRLCPGALRWPAGHRSGRSAGCWEDLKRKSPPFRLSFFYANAMVCLCLPSANRGPIEKQALSSFRSGLWYHEPLGGWKLSICSAKDAQSFCSLLDCIAMALTARRKCKVGFKGLMPQR